MDNPNTLIIIPTYNESENIARLCERLLALYPFVEILVVDDSSPDGTAAVVREEQRKYPDRWLHLTVRQGKGGRGSAVLEGFRFALSRAYELIFEMDADFSHEPEEIPRFLEKIRECDMVVGSRYLPKSEIHEWGWKRTFFSRFANRYARFVLGMPLSDYTNGYRCYRRSAVGALDLEKIDAKGYVVLSEVAMQLHMKGFRIGEVPTVFVNRRRGLSNLTAHEIGEAFLSILKIYTKYPGTRAKLGAGQTPHASFFRRHFFQGLKFAVVGALGATIDLSSLTFFVEVLDIHPSIAFIPSTFLAVLFVFLANKHFTFRNLERRYGSQAMKFAVVYGAAICLNIGLSNLLLFLGLHYFLAKVLAIGTIAVWNYVMSHHFVFRKEQDAEVPLF